MAPVAVRAAVEEDRSFVEAIAGDALSALAGSPSVARWGTNMRRSFIEHWFPPLGAAASETQMLVAEIDGTPAAAGSTRPGRRHPHTFIRLAVSQIYRRRGVGTALFDALTTNAAGPFVAREMLSDPGTINFFQRRGFVVGERTIEGHIDPTFPETSEWIHAVTSPRSRVVIATSPDVAPDLDVARAADDLYRWTHPWSVPRTLDNDEAIDLYLRGVRPDGRLTAWLDEELVGVSLITPSPFGTGRRVAHLALCGVVRPELRRAQEITQRLVGASLIAARRRGAELETEINQPNSYLWETINQIPGSRLFSDLVLMVSRYGS